VGRIAKSQDWHSFEKFVDVAEIILVNNKQVLMALGATEV
jgi:hypothetical protein